MVYQNKKFLKKKLITITHHPQNFGVDIMFDDEMRETNFCVCFFSPTVIGTVHLSHSSKTIIGLKDDTKLLRDHFYITYCKQ